MRLIQALAPLVSSMVIGGSFGWVMARWMGRRYLKDVEECMCRGEVSCGSCSVCAARPRSASCFREEHPTRLPSDRVEED